MRRSKHTDGYNKKLKALQDLTFGLVSRIALSQQLGLQYKGERKIYQALGYPQDFELDYEYFYNKYDRQDIASAVIDKPADKSWNSFQYVTSSEEGEEDSGFKKKWEELEESLDLNNQFKRLDKLAGIGEYSVLLLGFNDVKENKDFARPATGQVKLIYTKAVSQANADIVEWETNTANKRYGRPLFYQIKVGKPGAEASTVSLRVHHSRVLHIKGESLESDVFGRPRLKPIINRLLDLEKLMGGDAEMFWRGARPGYTATNQEGYEMTEEEIELLQDQLTGYENDLRRFLMAQGADIKSLDQQVSDPANHVDIQIQGISAQTGIPKRILTGSERGELSSNQDEKQWLELIKTRVEDFNEPVIVKSFVMKCIEHGILPNEEWKAVWEDLFAPSEKEKAEVGKTRADSIKAYSESLSAQELMPPRMFFKYVLGLKEDQIEEIMQDIEGMSQEESRDFRGVDPMEEEEEQNQQPGLRRTA